MVRKPHSFAIQSGYSCFWMEFLGEFESSRQFSARPNWNSIRQTTWRKFCGFRHWITSSHQKWWLTFAQVILASVVDSLAMVMKRLLYKLPIECCLIFASKKSPRSGFAVECLLFVWMGNSTLRRRNGSYPFVSWKCCFSFKHSNIFQRPQSSNDFGTSAIAFFLRSIFFLRIFYARFKFKATNSMTLLHLFYFDFLMKVFVEQFICVSKWKRWVLEEIRTLMKRQSNDDDSGGDEENVLSVLASSSKSKSWIV